MNDAALLGVNQGFGGGLVHVFIAGLFAVALLVLFWLDRLSTTTGRRKGRDVMLSYGTALLVALGIGFHSLGEGVEIGSLIAYSYRGARSIIESNCCNWRARIWCGIPSA